MQEAQNHFKKKVSFYKERDENKREEFKKELEKIPEENRVYIDESGINDYCAREYARGRRGMQIFGGISGRKYARESFVAGKIGSQILAPFCYKGTCDTKVFNVWLRQFLVPQLRPGQVVIMDNASFHKSEESKRLIQEAGCKILFLPPYSPDLNPIEIFWANFKKLVRSNLEKIQNLSKAIDFSFLTVLGCV